MESLTYKGPLVVESYLKKKRSSLNQYDKSSKTNKTNLRFFRFSIKDKHFCYKENKETPEIKVIHTGKDLINFSEEIPRTEDVSCDFKYGFCIKTNFKTYYLYAETEELYLNWMRILNFYFNNTDILKSSTKYQKHVITKSNNNIDNNKILVQEYSINKNITNKNEDFSKMVYTNNNTNVSQSSNFSFTDEDYNNYSQNSAFSLNDFETKKNKDLLKGGLENINDDNDLNESITKEKLVEKKESDKNDYKNNNNDINSNYISKESNNNIFANNIDKGRNIITNKTINKLDLRNHNNENNIPSKNFVIENSPLVEKDSFMKKYNKPTNKFLDNNINSNSNTHTNRENVNITTNSFNTKNKIIVRSRKMNSNDSDNNNYNKSREPKFDFEDKSLSKSKEKKQDNRERSPSPNILKNTNNNKLGILANKNKTNINISNIANNNNAYSTSNNIKSISKNVFFNQYLDINDDIDALTKDIDNINQSNQPLNNRLQKSNNNTNTNTIKNDIKAETKSTLINSNLKDIYSKKFSVINYDFPQLQNNINSDYAISNNNNQLDHKISIIDINDDDVIDFNNHLNNNEKAKIVKAKPLKSSETKSKIDFEKYSKESKKNNISVINGNIVFHNLKSDTANKLNNINNTLLNQTNNSFIQNNYYNQNTIKERNLANNNKQNDIEINNNNADKSDIHDKTTNKTKIDFGLTSSIKDCVEEDEWTLDQNPKSAVDSVNQLIGNRLSNQDILEKIKGNKKEKIKQGLFDEGHMHIKLASKGKNMNIENLHKSMLMEEYIEEATHNDDKSRENSQERKSRLNITKPKQKVYTRVKKLNTPLQPSYLDKYDPSKIKFKADREIEITANDDDEDNKTKEKVTVSRAIVNNDDKSWTMVFNLPDKLKNNEVNVNNITRLKQIEKHLEVVDNQNGVYLGNISAINLNRTNIKNDVSSIKPGNHGNSEIKDNDDEFKEIKEDNEKNHESNYLNNTFTKTFINNPNLNITSYKNNNNDANSTMIFRKARKNEIDNFNPGTHIESINFNDIGDNFHVPVQRTFKNEVTQATYIRDDLHLNLSTIMDLNQMKSKNNETANNNISNETRNFGISIIKEDRGNNDDNNEDTKNENGIDVQLGDEVHGFDVNQKSENFVNKESKDNKERGNIMLNSRISFIQGSNETNDQMINDISKIETINVKTKVIPRLSQLNIDEEWDRSIIDDEDN